MRKETVVGVALRRKASRRRDGVNPVAFTLPNIDLFDNIAGAKINTMRLGSAGGIAAPNSDIADRHAGAAFVRRWVGSAARAGSRIMLDPDTRYARRELEDRALAARRYALPRTFKNERPVYN